MATGPSTVRTVAARCRRYRAGCPQAQGRSGAPDAAASTPHTPASRALPNSCTAAMARCSTAASVRGPALAQRLNSAATAAIRAIRAAWTPAAGRALWYPPWVAGRS